MAGGVNNSRLVSMTYPNGRVLELQLQQRPGRHHQPAQLALGQHGNAGSYNYLGLSTVVERDHPQTGSGPDLHQADRASQPAMPATSTRAWTASAGWWTSTG